MSLSGQVSGTETATLGGALIPKVAHAHPGFGHAPILIKVCFWGDLQALPLPQRMISMRMMKVMWMTRMSTRRRRRWRSCRARHIQSRPRESERPAVHSSLLHFCVAPIPLAVCKHLT